MLFKHRVHDFATDLTLGVLAEPGSVWVDLLGAHTIVHSCFYPVIRSKCVRTSLFCMRRRVTGSEDSDTISSDYLCRCSVQEPNLFLVGLTTHPVIYLASPLMPLFVIHPALSAQSSSRRKINSVTIFKCLPVLGQPHPAAAGTKGFQYISCSNLFSPVLIC